MTCLTELGALDARERMARGELSAVEIAHAYVKRIAARDPEIGAWAHVDAELALSLAQAADEYRRSGRPLGPLHGVPVGLQDIIDTRDLPTENGTLIDAGRQPSVDAWLVRRLRGAGSIVLGKTVSTECAYLAPARTRNPHDTSRTTGGSPAGSAAAVATGMAPIAVAMQGAGSVIGPASYCGVVGFKPSFGLIPRSGVLTLARPLDTVGTMARSIDDAAALADVLAGYDPADVDTAPSASPRILEIARSDPPVTPKLAFIKTPAWGSVEAECAQGFAELAEALGGECDEVALPDVFAEAELAHGRVLLAEVAKNLRHYYERGRDQLAPQTRAGIEDGRGIAAVDYLAALDWREVLYDGLGAVFDRYDAIATPAAAGEAPSAPEAAGDPAFNALWTFTGVPAVTLPLLKGGNGLPVGVQLVGRRGYDGRLMRTARWLVKRLGHCGASR